MDIELGEARERLPCSILVSGGHGRHRSEAVSTTASRYTDWPVASLLRVTSRPAWRRPVKAARTVCGSQPSRCPISATEAPSGRSSMPISTARFVLARGRSASGILAIAKLTPSAIRSDCEAGSSGGGVVFFDRPMLLEVPLEAAAASAAASPVWVAVDFDRACGVRRRGVRWRPRAGRFASPISDFSALFACLRGCLLAIVLILWIRIALRDACTTPSPALGARRVATQEGAVDMDSNASRAGEVERKVWRDNDFLLPGKLLKMSPLVDGQSLCQPCGSGGRGAVSLLALAQLRCLQSARA